MEREVAWRVFAGEFNDSSVEQRGEEERSPTFLVSPLGAKINRVFAVGVITDLENLGSPSEPLWRARMTDPTGTFFISAGQFQPEAAVALSKLKPPAFAAVIGKVRTYSPEEGMLYVSIRPEVVRSVTGDIRDYWVLETAKSLKQRIEAFSEGRNMVEPSVDELMRLGYPKRLGEGIVTALEEYENVPLERYERMLADALAYLLPENRDSDVDLHVAEPDDLIDIDPDDEEEEIIEVLTHNEPDDIPVPEGPDEPGSGSTKGSKDYGDDLSDDEELTDEEEKVLDIIGDLDKEGTGIEWTDLQAAGKKAKLRKDVIEEAIMGLLDKGLVYEPVLGKIRKI